jgi:hypothetical protein
MIQCELPFDMGITSYLGRARCHVVRDLAETEAKRR